VHNPNCSSASRATNCANRTCVELKENLQREATKDQLAFSLWKSVFLKKLLEAGTGPMSGKFNFSFTSPHLANTSHSQVLNYFLIGLSILYTIAIVFFFSFFYLDEVNKSVLVKKCCVVISLLSLFFMSRFHSTFFLSLHHY
jgi:hypothetical protein